jgi:DNA-binding XRE family transcriptional regulator
MKAITLDEFIEKSCKDPEFKKLYEKEQMINAISKMVYEMRERVGLTQAQFAKKAKTTQPVIARLESGRDSRTPSLELLMKIADAAGAKLNIEFQL